MNTKHPLNTIIGEFTRVGSVRTYGGHTHLAYEYADDKGELHFTIACSCKGTANGQIYRGNFAPGVRGTCKGSIKRLSNPSSPLARAFAEIEAGK